MRILYITNGIKGAGGLERVLSIKASYLADKLGYDVHILTLNNCGAKPFYDFSPKIKMHDVVVGGNPFSYIRKYLNGIESAIKRIQPQVISVCDDGLKGFFLPLVLKKSCPMIYERHVSKIIELGENPGFKKRTIVNLKFMLMNLLGKRFDKFVVLTNDNVPEWNLDNIAVISNPLSFYPVASSSLNQKRIIAVGKQSYQKGFDLLLQAFQIIHKKHPDWQLSIYGKFNEKLKLPELASKLSIDKSVQFFEPVKDIQGKFLESSIFAFSSRFEGFGMVLTEAMACGVPCVSFDCPCGPSDIVSELEDGFLVENGNIEAFAEKIIVLIEDENLRINFGQHAKENVKRYLPEAIVPQWDELFKSLT